VSRTTTQERLATKTPEAAFLQVLKEEFRFSPRVSRELLNTAKEMLLGNVPPTALRPGQVRLVVTSLDAPFGPPLTEADKVKVTLTVDAGQEDVAVAAREGRNALRRGRILRLTEEALARAGVLTQEDLVRMLQVSPRTIRRDMQALQAAEHVVQTRGFVKGVGRGQTHKVRIIELWLDREGYDKIARWMHHSPQALQRYVSAFLRIASLHQQGAAVPEIAFLTRTSERLVQDYLGLYEAALDTPHRRENLSEELARVRSQAPSAPEAGPKGGLQP
jgi:hypothetical protein